MPGLNSNLAKWWATIKVAMVNLTTYRMNFVLQILGPAFFFYFIKYNLWRTVYEGHGGGSLSGYTFQGMMDYHAWILVSGMLYKGSSSNNLSEDIRMGRISTYLIYPFNFWEFHTSSFLAFELVQIFICSITLVFLVFFGLISTPSIPGLMLGLGFSFLGGLLWYLFQYAAGLLAFWLEETWMIRVLFELIAQFMSGGVVPLEMYPAWLKSSLHLTPFPYLTYYPAKAFMLQIEDPLRALGIVAFWIVALFGLNQWLWRRGMRLYTGAGM